MSIKHGRCPHCKTRLEEINVVALLSGHELVTIEAPPPINTWCRRDKSGKKKTYITLYCTECKRTYKLDVMTAAYRSYTGGVFGTFRIAEFSSVVGLRVELLRTAVEENRLDTVTYVAADESTEDLLLKTLRGNAGYKFNRSRQCPKCNRWLTPIDVLYEWGGRFLEEKECPIKFDLKTGKMRKWVPGVEETKTYHKYYYHCLDCSNDHIYNTFSRRFEECPKYTYIRGKCGTDSARYFSRVFKLGVHIDIDHALVTPGYEHQIGKARREWCKDSNSFGGFAGTDRRTIEESTPEIAISKYLETFPADRRLEVSHTLLVYLRDYAIKQHRIAAGTKED